MRGSPPNHVISGLVPGIHVRDESAAVDGRDKPGHDSGRDGAKAAAMDTNPTIRLDNVTLRRGGREVLSALSLTLTERRIGLIGDNGSGKSSLVRLMNGLLSADVGSVTVHGLDAAKDSSELPRKVGFIFQNPDHQIIFPTVIEEVAFSLEQTGLSRREAASEAKLALARFERAHWADRPVHALSEGEKQLLCIIAVLVMQPAVLVLDEPFSALDLPTRRRLEALIATLDQQVILIAHELDAFGGYDRVLWLEAGRVRMDGAPGEVIAAYRRAVEEGG
ncbi:MAG: transporter related protein [Xanthobacteraceae bacterium]|nr:transporter related protein [Xanthobacteraceae bacterium]